MDKRTCNGDRIEIKQKEGRRQTKELEGRYDKVHTHRLELLQRRDRRCQMTLPVVEQLDVTADLSDHRLGRSGFLFDIANSRKQLLWEVSFGVKR